MIIISFPTHDELGTCEASLDPPKQSVLSILVGCCYATQLTVTHCNIIDIGCVLVLQRQFPGRWFIRACCVCCQTFPGKYKSKVKARASSFVPLGLGPTRTRLPAQLGASLSAPLTKMRSASSAASLSRLACSLASRRACNASSGSHL